MSCSPLPTYTHHTCYIRENNMQWTTTSRSDYPIPCDRRESGEGGVENEESSEYSSLDESKRVSCALSKVEESDEHWDEVGDNDGEVVVGRVGSRYPSLLRKEARGEHSHDL